MSTDEKNYEYDYDFSEGSSDDRSCIRSDWKQRGWEYVDQEYIDGRFVLTFRKPIKHED